MTTAEDIEKAVELLELQLNDATLLRDEAQLVLVRREARVKYFRDAIQGLRRMEIERERNGQV